MEILIIVGYCIFLILWFLNDKYKIIYFNHCWRCFHSIVSFFCDRCSVCHWYICNKCGVCSSESCRGHALRKMMKDKEFYNKCHREICECYFGWSRKDKGIVYDALVSFWKEDYMNLDFEEYKQALIRKREEYRQKLIKLEEERIIEQKREEERKKKEEIKNEKKRILNLRQQSEIIFLNIKNMLEPIEKEIVKKYKYINKFYGWNWEDEIDNIYLENQKDLTEYIVNNIKESDITNKNIIIKDMNYKIKKDFDKMIEKLENYSNEKQLEIKSLIKYREEEKLNEINCFKIIKISIDKFVLSDSNKNIFEVKMSRCMRFDDYVQIAIYDSEGYDSEGFDKEGYGREGYDEEGYDKEGYNKKGYDKKGYDRKGYNKKGYYIDGYNKEGYDEGGYDREGYNKEGYDKEGFNKKGFDKHGFNRDGYYVTNRYDGSTWKKSFWIYDEYGYDKNGYDIRGNKRPEYHKKK